MTRRSDDGALGVRVAGVLGIVIGCGAITAGLMNAGAENPSRDIRAFAAVGVYFVAVGGGTVALRRIAALLLVVPLAIAGIASVVGAVVSGPAVAAIVNLFVTAPLLCGPAFVVWRNRRCLR